MTFCPPEGTHIVPSIAKNYDDLKINDREMKEPPKTIQALTKYQTEE